MYKKNPTTKTSLTINQSYKGEALETKVKRFMDNKEPITDGTELIYTDRKDGILPQYDIRTDRMALAIETKDAQAKQDIARRDGKLTIGEEAQKNMKIENNREKNNGGTEPIPDGSK